MSSTDTRGLTGQRPSSQRPLGMVSATVSTQQAAPSSFAEPLNVVLDGSMVPMQFVTWPQSHGTSLPVAGDSVIIGYDQKGVPHVLQWRI